MDVFEITPRDDHVIWETYPPMPQAVKLLDGALVTVRSIRPDDAPRLQALFNRLSQDSIFLRFLQHRKELPYEQAVHLSTVDYDTRMALVATREQQEIVAVARYAVTDPDCPDRAEAAIVVEDQYQGRGLGMVLLKWLLVYAQTHDIWVFQAIVAPNNTQILRFIERSGLPYEKKLEQGAWEITINTRTWTDMTKITCSG